MKNSKITKLIAVWMVLWAWTISPSQAQKIDMAKMEKDIEVAENILLSMTSMNQVVRIGSGDNKYSQYLEGYGVILSVPQNMNRAFRVTGVRRPPQVEHPAEIARLSEAVSSAVRGEMKTEELEAKTKELEARAEALAAEALSGSAWTINNNSWSYGYHPDGTRAYNMDSIRLEQEEATLVIFKDFLLDYAMLIGQLKDNDRIKVAERDRFTSSWYSDGGELSGNLSTEIKKADLDAYRSGKISREEAEKRMTINRRGETVKLENDLQLLSTIFGRIYSSSMTDSYYANGSIRADRIKDFGVIYWMNAVSSQQIKDGYYLPGAETKEPMTKEARDQKVKELYPLFENSLKENILDYGRTIKSLDKAEQLVVRVKLTRCEGCGIPENIELSIKADILYDYAAGKTDRKNALAAIKLTQKGKQ